MIQQQRVLLLQVQHLQIQQVHCLPVMPFLETMQRAQTVQAPAFRKVLFSFYQYNL